MIVSLHRNCFLANINTRTIAAILWMLLLPFSLSLMRWRDWQECWGHITSHLVSSVATCAPQCHRAVLCLRSPPASIYLAASTTPHLAHFALWQRQPCLGHIWRHPSSGAQHTMVKIMLRTGTGKCNSLKCFIYILCIENLISVWVKIC